MLVKDLMQFLAMRYPYIHDTLTLSQLSMFTTMSADFLTRSRGVLRSSPKHAPIEFLGHCLDRRQTIATWSRLWNITYHAIPSCLYIPDHFKWSGIAMPPRPKHRRTITEHTFLPPTVHCTRCEPNKDGTSNALMKREIKYGYVFDITGIETMQYRTTYCRKCGTTYTPCYLRSEDIREYYTDAEGQPLKYFHVTQHYFMSHQLALYFNQLQGHAAVSVQNLVISYNQTHASKKTVYSNDFKNPRYTRWLSPNVCSLGLDIHRLLRIYQNRGIHLTGFAKGADDRRFHPAMEQHLEWLKHEGTPFAAHTCSTCTHIVPIPNTGKAKIMHAMVTDGITVGHWCCSASPEQVLHFNPNSTENYCSENLAKTNARYCATHTALLNGICQAQPCLKPARDGQATCENVDHIAAHKAFIERNSSLFGLRKQIIRPNASINIDPSLMVSAETGEVDISEEDLLNADVEERQHKGARDGGEGEITPRLLLSRGRTHNEQLMVAPCGVIMGRKTFYRSETVPKVKDFIREVFPEEMPQVIFYDNACGLYSHIQTNPTDAAAFRNTLLPVDAFHIKSHKESHTTCRTNNDPNLFPELKKGNGSWLFNTSAGEIANSWFGKFDSMCRTMHPTRYNFFLEEMIFIHNTDLVEKIEKRSNVTFVGNLEYNTSPIDHLIP